MRAPPYQNALEIVISIAFLALYTVAIKTINQSGELDAIESFLYVQPLVLGSFYLNVWNVSNAAL